MRIAFDVKGTLEGPREHLVLGLLIQLQELGHEIIVWSNSFGYAVDCAKNLGLVGVRVESKRNKWNTPAEDFYDVAIEDMAEQRDWLAAKRVILVSELPGAMRGIHKLAKQIGSEK